MAKRYLRRGFTLMELMFVLAIASVLLGVAFPAVDKFLSQQRLKQSVSQVTSFVQSARSMASSTECPTQFTLRNVASALQLDLSVIKQDKWRGCLRWFEARGTPASASVSVSSLSLASVQVRQNNQVLRFDAVSGAPEGTAIKIIQLVDRGQEATIQINGIGNGTLQ